MQRKHSLQKGTCLYKEQENIWIDQKLCNHIMDLLSSDKVGFPTNGSEMSAAGKNLVKVLTEVLCEIVPAERRRRSEDRKVLNSSLTSSTLIRQRHKHGCLLQPSRSGIWLLFPFNFLCLHFKRMRIKSIKAFRLLNLQNCLSWWGAGGLLFGPKLFFSPGRGAFEILMLRETNKIITVALMLIWTVGSDFIF